MPDERVVKASNLKLPSLEDSDDELEALENGSEGEEGSDGDGDGDGDGGEGALSVCKKPLEVKCREALFGSAKLAQKLVKLCTEECRELMCSPHGSEVLTETVLACENGVFEGKVSEEDVEALFDGVVKIVSDASALLESESCKKKPKKKAAGAGAAEESESVLENFYGSRTLKTLVLASCSEGKAVVAKKLWTEVDGSKWVGTQAEKILRGYAMCSVKKMAAKAQKILKAKK